MIERKQWLGRAIAVGILVGATVVVALALLRLDARPRTHDGYLYADTSGLAADVSGRIVKLAVRETALLREMTLTGVLAIQAGLNPKLVRERLSQFVAEHAPKKKA